MKTTIRLKTFETNSSSTHSMIMMSDEEYKKLEKGELYIDRWDEKLLTKEEVLEKIKKHGYTNISDYNEREGMTYCTLDEYFDDDYLEGFEDSYKTKSGEIVHAVGKYGYNG